MSADSKQAGLFEPTCLQSCYAAGGHEVVGKYGVLSAGVPESTMRVTLSLSQDDSNRIESIRSVFARHGRIPDRSAVVRPPSILFGDRCR
jgi:hypothetical protein